ncbi:hypothetical protein ACQP3F_33950, partial [Escherichia coli]
ITCKELWIFWVHTVLDVYENASLSSHLIYMASLTHQIRRPQLIRANIQMSSTQAGTQAQLRLTYLVVLA